MFCRSISSTVQLAATLVLVVGCGSTTTVTQPSDAGCEAATLLDASDPDGGLSLPDGEPLCPKGACNYQTQTGCASERACRPQFSATSSDVSPGCELAGTGKSGAACSAGSDCAVGFYCAGKVCRKQCCGGDSSVCDPGDACFRALEVEAGGQTVSSGMELCFPTSNCDLLDTNSCGAGMACAIVDTAGHLACVGASGAAAPGGTCSASRSCAAGASCVGGTCRPFCHVLACGGTTCGADQGECVHFSRDPAGVGECTPE